MKGIEYITVRVGLKFIVLFQDDFIDNDYIITMKYLKYFLSLLYDKDYFDVIYQSHDFIGEE